jgi:hypothetical protein
VRDRSCRGKTGVAKSNTALLEQGRHFLLKGGLEMLRVNVRFNLAIHLPLQWIAALLYLLK